MFSCVGRSVRLASAYLHDDHSSRLSATLMCISLSANERCSVTDRTILRVIKKIKNTITGVNNDWIDRHFAFFKGLEEIKDTECALALKFGSDCYIVCGRKSSLQDIMLTVIDFVAQFWCRLPLGHSWHRLG